MAEEIAAGLPTAAVIASEDGFLAGQLQHAVNSTLFRVYVNPDLVGVELCAAAKNVIALAAGGVDGLGLGDNAKASLIARGLAEMSRLGDAAGARPETFSGLAGIGDLVVTCWSRHGRNRHAGELIAQGLTPEQAVAEIGETVEGLTTAPVLRDLAHRLDVELPITEGVCAVLSGENLGGLVARADGARSDGGVATAAASSDSVPLIAPSVAEDRRVLADPLPERRRPDYRCASDSLSVAEVARVEANRAKPELAACLTELVEQRLE